MSPEEWLKQEQERMKAASKPAETEAPEPKLPAADVDFGKKTAEFEEKAAAKQKEDVKAMREEKPMGLPDWMRDTLIATGAVAAATLAGYTGYKRGKKAEQIAAQRGKPPAEPIEPTFDLKPTTQLSEAEKYYGGPASTPQEKRMMEASYRTLQQKQGMAVPQMAPPTPTVAPQPPIAPPAAVAPSAMPVAPAPIAVPPGVAPVPPAAVAPSATPVAPEALAPAAPPAEKKARVPKAPVEAKAVLGVPPEQTPTGYYKGAVPPEVQARYAGITGAGGNYLYNILGPEKYQDFLQKYGKGLDTGNYKAAAALWEKHGAEYLQGFGPGTTKEIRKERNLKPPNLGTFGKVGESGAATLPAMLNLAGNALGAVGLAKAYEHGTKTGDYSDFGLGVIGQLLANTVPKAATPFALMSPGGLNVNEQAELARRRGMAPTID